MPEQARIASGSTLAQVLLGRVRAIEENWVDVELLV